MRHTSLALLLLLVLLCACAWPGSATTPTPVPSATAKTTPSRPVPEPTRAVIPSAAAIVPATPTPPLPATASRTPSNPAAGLFATWTAEASAEAAAWERLYRRPLKLPAVPPGAACPRTPARQGIVPDFPIVGGDGPIYATTWQDGGLYKTFGRLPAPDGWHYHKIIWVASPDYPGPALVRGGRIDGQGELRFADSFAPGVVAPEAERRLGPPSGTSRTEGVRNWGGYTLWRGPGCYAYQIDGFDFSYVLVFEVAP